MPESRHSQIIEEIILVCSADRFDTLGQIEDGLKRQSKKLSEDPNLREKYELTINYFIKQGFLWKFDPAYQGNVSGVERYMLTSKGITYKKDLFEGLMKIVDEVEGMSKK